MSWLTAHQLAGLPGLPATRQNVLLRAEAESWACRPREGRGGGLEFLRTDLPEFCVEMSSEERSRLTERSP